MDRKMTLAIMTTLSKAYLANEITWDDYTAQRAAMATLLVTL